MQVVREMFPLCLILISDSDLSWPARSLDLAPYCLLSCGNPEAEAFKNRLKNLEIVAVQTDKLEIVMQG